MSSECEPDCPLCAVNRKMEDHYNSCKVCQGPEYPCKDMIALHKEEQEAIRIVFPDIDDD